MPQPPRLQGMDTTARGTVAQVLASARASLKDGGSRPFTPAEGRQSSILDTRPSSAFERPSSSSNSFERPFGRETTNHDHWTNPADDDGLNTRKARNALGRGLPASRAPVGSDPPLPSSPVPQHGGGAQYGRSSGASTGASEVAPRWVGELDKAMPLLDGALSLLADEGPGGAETLAVRDVLSVAVWPCVEAMAGACGDADERWVQIRNRLFSSLFRVLERKEPELRIAAARCVVRILSAGRASTAPSLQLPKYEAAVCKVLFGLTRSTVNDEAFFESGCVAPMLALLEAQARQLGSTSPARVPLEAPVFLTGALKNLSASGEGAQLRLGSLGAVSVLCEAMRACAGLRDTPDFDEGQRGALLTQASGCLRNLSLAKAHHRQMARCGAASLLCGLVRAWGGHKELMVNVARVLAKLSLHETFRGAMNADPQHLIDLLGLLQSTGPWALPRHSGCAPGPAAAQGVALMVRLAFTLGNLTASNERNRSAVLRSSVGCEGLVRLLVAAHEAWKEGWKGAEGRGGGVPGGAADDEMAGELEDLLVKLLRLVANLAISAEAGPVLVTSEGLSCLAPLMVASLGRAREELLLNAVSAVTNLSFYHVPPGAGGGETSVVLREARPLVGALVEALLHPNGEMVAEAARAFGNFSRSLEGRRLMADLGAGEALVILLDHPARDVVVAAAGALVNVGSDPSSVRALLSPSSSAPSSSSCGGTNGCAKLVCLVRRMGLRDTPLAAVCCKALYNTLGVARSLNGGGMASQESRGLSGSEVGRLVGSLEELLEVADEDDDKDFATAAGALMRLAQGLAREMQASTQEQGHEAASGPGAGSGDYEDLDFDAGHK